MDEENPSVAPDGDVLRFTTDAQTQHDFEFFVRFLDEANATPGVRDSKPLIVEGLHLRVGQTVLDVGCGLGTDVIDVAHKLGPTGRVVGIDTSQQLINEARFRGEGLLLPVEFHTADALDLPFDDGNFDACRAERVLLLLADPKRALSEMVRVTRSGGRIAIFDYDLDTWVIDSQDRDTTNAILSSFVASVPHPWIGSRLPRLVLELGLRDVTVHSEVILWQYEFVDLLLSAHVQRVGDAGPLSVEIVRRWWEELQEMHKAGTFLSAVTAFIVSGTVP